MCGKQRPPPELLEKLSVSALFPESAITYLWTLKSMRFEISDEGTHFFDWGTVAIDEKKEEDFETLIDIGDISDGAAIPRTSDTAGSGCGRMNRCLAAHPGQYFVFP
jgi:hypothetical protein